MQHATCICGNRLFFDNTSCLACGRHLGFLPDSVRLVALEPDAQGSWRLAENELAPPLRDCANRKEAICCNWMIEAGDDGSLCRSCRLTTVIPNLAVDGNARRWRIIERAKRYLVYGLLRLGLPVIDRHADPQAGMAFAFMASTGGGQVVMTGHAGGVITLNIAEADDDYREHTRVLMGEPYRTVLGHLRHESGHYYWERIIPGSGWHEEFRLRFGDERLDYQLALQQHHDRVRSDWREEFISCYASAHPWEDWAETWAHYLHLRDTLETAADLGLMVAEHDQYRRFLYNITDFRQLLGEWMRLTVIMNALARSVGAPDTYPFTFSPGVCSKLEFIHQVIHATGMREED